GRWFSYQHSQINPDVMTVAKALGNGVPIGACLAHGVAAEVLQPGSHGSTFGGNPLACAAGLAVMKVMEEEDLVSVAAAKGRYFSERLNEALKGCASVVDIRTQGLMIGIELDKPCGELVQVALKQGLLINVTAGNVVRLLPPLVITTEQIDSVIDTLSRLIRQL
ncbi:MAG TPA: aminotransferase class III-fold pyridoxal phosphate-dependent enzyme, partial [Candidatus Tenderia sp.]|nr:aminotransferase class III-fold pyridoxal phosphate-dependent enzyme [Candidatus Tenderia sp.]